MKFRDDGRLLVNSTAEGYEVRIYNHTLDQYYSVGITKEQAWKLLELIADVENVRPKISLDGLSHIDGLTHKEIIVACRNVGIDLTCPACANYFYTGINDTPHADNCTSYDRESMPVQANLATPVKPQAQTVTVGGFADAANEDSAGDGFA